MPTAGSIGRANIPTISSRCATLCSSRRAFSPYRFEVIGEFTRAFVEAFAADFSSEEGYRDILAWARGNSIDSDLLSLDDVLPSPSDDPARFMMLNVLNASLSWRNTFAAEDNVRAPFHLPNGEEKEIAYLHHAKRDAIVYDYGTYVSAYDDYDRSYTIQYLVPKSLDASIFDLLAEEGRNFLREEEEKRIVASEGADAGLILDLFVPKFTATARVDFSSAAEALGLKPLFTGEAGSFDRAFENAPEAIRLVSPKQVNRVSFTEDGTTVSTIAFMLGAGAAQPITGDEIRVELNQPFVYVIRDARGLPLYIGTNVSGD